MMLRSGEWSPETSSRMFVYASFTESKNPNRELINDSLHSGELLHSFTVATVLSWGCDIWKSEDAIS